MRIIVIQKPPRQLPPAKRSQARQPVIDVEPEVWVLAAPEFAPVVEFDVLDDEVDVWAVDVPEPKSPLPELAEVEDPVEVCVLTDPMPDGVVLEPLALVDDDDDAKV